MNIDLQAREITPLRHTYAHVAQRIGGDKTATRYQEATLGAQPETNFHYRPTWDPEHALFDRGRTAVQLADWYALRDPRQFYYATWTITRARQQDAMESNVQFVESRGLVGKMSDAVRAKACEVLMPLRHVAWGGNQNNASICAYGWGTAFTAPALFHAMDHLGVAQYLTKLGLALDEPGVLEAGRNDWLNDPRWQVLRRYVEDTLVLKDPFELFVAQNLALDGQLYPLIYGSFVDEHLALQGGTAVAMLTAFMPEWHDESARWIDAVVKVAAAESAENKALIAGWAQTWADRAQAALAPVAEFALGSTGQQALTDARQALDARLAKSGLAG
ncbi:MAG: Phenol hydroxylase, P1 oxygenase component DmpL [Burkholderiaceae bacterium]|jgi:phenol hydroxylase P1 protein|nr:MAG: Phenol hydroxylase, P1 oxygenase component DmpL [Burkholderiaceae bacterium]